MGVLSFAMILALPVWSQNVHVGMKVGVPITQYFETSPVCCYSAATRRYTLGPSFEWRATNTIGFEVDALYHRMGYVTILNTGNRATGVTAHTSIDVKGNSFDFPLVAKVRFGKVARPYVLGGGVLRHIGPVRGRGEQTVRSPLENTTVTTPIDTGEPPDLRKRFYPGITAGAAVEFPARRVRLLPEFRYTRWTANISGEGGLLRFAPNQAEVTIGLVF
jgi:hypothetical protein